MPSPKIKIRKKPTNKRCQDGYPCKTTCISRLKNCRNPLNGQATTLTLWLKHQEEMLEITNKKRARVGLSPATITKYGYITAERNFTGKKEAKPASPIESKAAISSTSSNKSDTWKDTSGWGNGDESWQTLSEGDMSRSEFDDYYRKSGQYDKDIKEIEDKISLYEKKQSDLVKTGGGFTRFTSIASKGTSYSRNKKMLENAIAKLEKAKNESLITAKYNQLQREKKAIASPVPTPQENIISLGKKGRDGFSTAIVSIGDGYGNGQKQQQKGYLIGDYFISNGLKSKAYYQVQHLPTGMSLANGERLKALTGKADLASAKQIAKKLFDANLTFAKKEDTEAFKQSLSDALDVMYDRKPATPNDRADRAPEPLKELAKLRIDPEVAAPSPETKQADSNPSSNKELMAKFREALDSNSAIADDELQQIKITAPDIVEKYKNVLQIRKKTGQLSDAQLKQLDDLENLDNPKPAIAEPVTEKQTKGGYESLPDSKWFTDAKSTLSLPNDKWEPGERESVSSKTIKDAIAAAKKLSPQEIDFLLSPQKFPPSELYDPILKLKEIQLAIKYTAHLSTKEHKLLNAYKEISKNLGFAKDRYEKAHTPLQISIRKNSLNFPDDGIDPFTTQKLERAQSEWDQVKDDYDRLVNLNEQRKQSLMADYNKAITEVRKSAKNSASPPSPETKSVAEVQSKPKNNGNGSESAIANKESIETTFQSLVSVPEKIKDKVESSLIDGMRSESSWNRTKERYKEYADAVKTGNIPKGYGDYYDQNAAIYDALIKGEKFVSKRRNAIDNGDYQTPLEAKLFLSKKIKNNKEFDYFDSQEYTTEYPKLFAVKGDYQLPPPLTGTIPSSEIKKFMRQGDQLLVKENTYGLGSNQISGTKIVDGGTLLKSNVKNVKTRHVGEYMGKPYERENNTPIADITHVIRDGKRYKII